MTGFDGRPILIFLAGEEYLFKEYIDQQALFDSLQPYYNGDEYRFEVPAAEFEAVSQQLREYGYDPRVVEDLEPYCVVKEQYTDHADILRNAIAHWQRRGHNFFLLEDELAVKAALEAGATMVAETDLAMGL